MPIDMTKKLADEITIYARRKETRLTIKQLFDFGVEPSPRILLTSAQYLHTELPIRIAKRVKELETAPYGLSEMPSVKRIHEWYVQTFIDLLDFPHPSKAEDDESFSELIERIKNRHNRVVSTMAQGIQELQRKLGTKELGDQLPAFLDRFYISRIGIRMLIGQHVALHHPQVDQNWVGIVCSNCRPADVARDAVAHARDVCVRSYGVAPPVGIYGRTDLAFTYVVSHLHHMLFELLKNSLRAVVETHPEDELPEVKLIIADGQEDIAIKISDEGGGIPRSGMSRIWTYLYTTAAPPPENAMYQTDFDPMAGYGYGLPISRLYARYFGGDLQVISMEGYGTDAYLHLNRLGDQEEALT